MMKRNHLNMASLDATQVCYITYMNQVQLFPKKGKTFLFACFHT